MNVIPIIKVLSFLMISDLILVSAGWYGFISHELFYDKPFVFVVSTMSLLLLLKLNIVVVVWATREAFE